MSEENEPAVEPTEEVVPPRIEPDDPQKRASECAEAIAAILSTFRCRVVPYILPKVSPVGEGPPTTVQLSSSYGIVPE